MAAKEEIGSRMAIAASAAGVVAYVVLMVLQPIALNLIDHFLVLVSIFNRETSILITVSDGDRRLLAVLTLIGLEVNRAPNF